VGGGVDERDLEQLDVPGARDQLVTATKFSVPDDRERASLLRHANALVAYGPAQPPTAPPAARAGSSPRRQRAFRSTSHWTDCGTNEDGYEVFQSSDNNTFTKVATQGVNAQELPRDHPERRQTRNWFKCARSTRSAATSFFRAIRDTANRDERTTRLPNLNFANGFTGSGGQLNFNGSAKISGSNAELTDGGLNQVGTIWSKNQLDVRKFSTNFSFQITNPNADGFTFAIQRVSNTVQGSGGGNLGYQGIGTSIALKFDIYQNISETGLYVNGAAPTSTGAFSTLPNIDLHSGHIMNCSLVYNGTSIVQTITDTVTNAVYTHTYGVTIPSLIGGNNAWSDLLARRAAKSRCRTFAPGRSSRSRLIRPRPRQISRPPRHRARSSTSHGPTTRRPKTASRSSASRAPAERMGRSTWWA
jgi:hypothetical protein